jgi:hypothetical protein
MRPIRSRTAASRSRASVYWKIEALPSSSATAAEKPMLNCACSPSGRRLDRRRARDGVDEDAGALHPPRLDAVTFAQLQMASSGAWLPRHPAWRLR